MATALALPVLPDAACASTPDPDVFYADRTEHRRLEQARNYCRRCPALRDCLTWALTTGEDHGVWAGTTPEQRHTLATRHADRSTS